MGGVFSQHQGGANYNKDARELIIFSDLYEEFAIILQEDNYNNAVDRLVTSFTTTTAEIDEFIEDLNS